MWCVTSITKEYRKRMYGLLDLYAKGYDEQFPVVCMDEKSKQLLTDLRGTIAMKPGSPAKYDYEYKRNGTRNIFVAVEPVSYTHLRAHETDSYLVCRLLLEKKKNKDTTT